MQYLKRHIEKNLGKWFFKGKIIVIYGPRQVGKTTLAKNLLKIHGQEQGYFNCDLIHVRQALEKEDAISLKRFIGENRFVVFDEAQRIRNIGSVLKILIDTYPDIQILATGSSSFDLSNKINEPLTGRALEFKLYPFSLAELSQIYAPYELDAKIPDFLIYGSYPEIIAGSQTDAPFLLDNLTSKYLYKDILEFEQLKRSDLVISLLQMLALQIGSEVSIHELAMNLHCGGATIARYLDLLEKAFVIFRLRAFSRNLRKEISKKHKYYFYDLGVRNSLISRYNPLHIREDVGALWENFCIAERIKYLQSAGKIVQQYFWRTHDQKEIDYVEEYNEKICGYELKWNKTICKKPKEFLSYPHSSVTCISQENYRDFLLP